MTPFFNFALLLVITGSLAIILVTLFVALRSRS
jgi:hypothetical protein